MAKYTAIEKALAKKMTEDQPELMDNFNGWSLGLIVQMLENQYIKDEIVDALLNLKDRGLIERIGDDENASFRFASPAVFEKAKTIS